MSVKCILQGQQTHQIALEDVITIDDGAHITTEESMGEGPYTLEFTQEEQLDVYPSNENILHNWYFPDPINQKNQNNSYQQDSYTIDRWYTSSLGANQTSGIEFDINGVKLTPGDVLTQPLEIEPFLINKKVTISALLSNGNLLTSSGIVQDGYFEMIIYDKDNSDSKIQIDLYRWSGFYNNKLNFMISIMGSDPATSVSVIAAKLELGPIQTLAHKEGDTWVLNDPPPDKATELAKCQRYQYLLNSKGIPYGYFGIGVAATIHRVIAIIPIPTSMRITPVISCLGNIIVSNTSPGSEIPVTNITFDRISENCLSVFVDTEANLELNMPYMFLSASDGTGQILIDANL